MTWPTDIYPVVICYDRYTGVYSGGRWTAWNGYQVPDGPMDDDVTCSDYWHNVLLNQILVGLGETPQEAYEDLVKKAKERKRTKDREP